MNVKALGIKLIIHSIVVFSIFGIFWDANLINLFWLSIITTAISYLIGDVFILRRFGNTIASISDFFLSFVTIALVSMLIIDNDMPLIVASLGAAFFIALTEPFLHAYITEQEKRNQNKHRISPPQFQTEFAEETDNQSVTKRKDPRRNQQK